MSEPGNNLTDPIENWHEKFCETKKTAVKIFGNTVIVTEKIKSIIDSILTPLTKILWGLVDVGDIISSQLISIAYGVASNLAQTLAQHLSKAVQDIMEAIFKPLLAILTAGPGALFGLVYAPHKATKKMLKKERKALYSAQDNVNSILEILKELLEFKDSRSYIAILEQVLPNIKNSISLLESIINELQPNDNSAPYLDKSKYNELKNELEYIIKKTDTGQFNELTGQINSYLQKSKQEEYNKKKKEINKKMKPYFNELKQWYQSKVVEDAPEPESMSDTVTKILEDITTKKNSITKEEIINNTKDNFANTTKGKNQFYQEIYESGKEALEDLKEAQEEVHKATSITAGKWSDVKEIGENFFKNKAERYSYMVHMLGQYGKDFLENIKDASFAYHRYHQYCQSMATLKDFILNIASWFLDKIYNDVLADKTAEGFEQAKTIMENAEDISIESIKEYNNSNNNDYISQSEATINVAGVNTMTISTKVLVNTVMTESLANLINLKADFGEYEDEYNEFVKKLKSIIDWDGSREWIYSDTPSPYNKMITDVGGIIYSLSSFSQENDEIYNSIIQFRERINDLITHNYEVSQVIYDFKPTSHPLSEKLTKVLKSMGIFDLFIMANDMSSIIGAVKSFAAQISNISLDLSCEGNLDDLDDEVRAKGTMVIDQIIRPTDDPGSIDKNAENNQIEQESRQILSSNNLSDLDVEEDNPISNNNPIG